MINFRTFAATKIRPSSIIENEKVENINFLRLVIIILLKIERKRVNLPRKCVPSLCEDNVTTFGDPITLEL